MKELHHEHRRQGPQVPGVAAAEGAITGAVATEQDLPIADYDKQTADEIASKLKGLSQRELRTIDAYERKHAEPRDDHRPDRQALRRGALVGL